jgi:ABC-type dipeptide/oligopeptide/nickel transport system permease component
LRFAPNVTVIGDLTKKRFGNSLCGKLTAYFQEVPMTAMAIGFAILAALALGFVIGRIWQIRSDESLRRASFPMPSVARIPCPRDA